MLKVEKNPKLIGKDGADLVVSKDTLVAMMSKQENELKEKIKNAYKEFISKPIPDLSNYSFFDTHVVVDVFMFEEEKGIMGMNGKPLMDRMVFPVARVVAKGPNSFFKIGDFVKLKDYEASEIPNPAYELWTKNNMENGSLKKIGEAPPPVVSNFHVIHGKKCFNINPIRTNIDFADIKLFVLYEPNIECIINNPENLI